MKILEWKKKFSLANFVIENMEHEQRGGNIFVCCPFHHEETPSCIVKEDRFKCFGGGCGKSGDSIDFLMQSYGLTLSEVVNSGDFLEINADHSNHNEIITKKPVPLPTPEQIRKWNKSLMANKKIKGYIGGRHINDNAIQRFNLGFGSTRYYRGEKIIIPVFSHNSLVNMRYRVAPGEEGVKYLAHPGISPSLFNIDDLKSNRIVIAGSELDAIALSSEGIPAVSLPGEGIFMDSWIPLFSGKSVLIWLDYDWPGVEGSIKVYNKIKIVSNAKIFDWPNIFANGNDIENFISKLGIGEAKRVFECLT